MTGVRSRWVQEFGALHRIPAKISEWFWSRLQRALRRTFDVSAPDAVVAQPQEPIQTKRFGSAPGPSSTSSNRGSIPGASPSVLVVVGVRVTADSVWVVVVVAAGSLTTVVHEDRAIPLIANKVSIFINQLDAPGID